MQTDHEPGCDGQRHARHGRIEDPAMFPARDLAGTDPEPGGQATAPRRAVVC